MTDTCIEYRDVSKSYGDNTILSNLNLSIERDITTVIVGESGSGKSTLLQMANGLIVPEQGQVSVFDTKLDRDNIIATRLGIGYSVQGAGLFPHLSIFENISVMARLQGWPDEKIRLRYHYLLELLGLDAALSDRFPYSLSGGQQQRASLCRAMMLNPSLLLLDEPFSALDPLTRDSIYQEFIKLQHAETRSVVLVTHNMREAIKLAQQIIVLSEGKIEQQGSVSDIQNNPASEYVETLFRIGIDSR